MLEVPQALIKPMTSSRVNTTGSVRGTNTAHLLHHFAAIQRDVEEEPNPVWVALRVIGEVP